MTKIDSPSFAAKLPMLKQQMGVVCVGARKRDRLMHRSENPLVFMAENHKGSGAQHVTADTISPPNQIKQSSSM